MSLVIIVGVSEVNGCQQHYENSLKLDVAMCSCFWQNGLVRKVPASRADVFQDTSLPLLSKRVLMRFLKSTQEAVQDSGLLKVIVLYFWHSLSSLKGDSLVGDDKIAFCILAGFQAQLRSSKM